MKNGITDDEIEEHIDTFLESVPSELKLTFDMKEKIKSDSLQISEQFRTLIDEYNAKSPSYEQSKKTSNAIDSFVERFKNLLDSIQDEKLRANVYLVWWNLIQKAQEELDSDFFRDIEALVLSNVNIKK